jgi:hypothetical protein
MHSPRLRFVSRYFAITLVAALMSVPALGLLPLGAWLVAILCTARFIHNYLRFRDTNS